VRLVAMSMYLHSGGRNCLDIFQATKIEDIPPNYDFTGQLLFDFRFSTPANTKSNRRYSVKYSGKDVPK